MRSFTLALHFDHDVLNVGAAGCLISAHPERNSSWLLCAYKTQLLTCKEMVWGLNLALMGPVLPAIKQTLLTSIY